MKKIIILPILFGTMMLASCESVTKTSTKNTSTSTSQVETKTSEETTSSQTSNEQTSTSTKEETPTTKTVVVYSDDGISWGPLH